MNVYSMTMQTQTEYFLGSIEEEHFKDAIWEKIYKSHDIDRKELDGHSAAALFVHLSRKRECILPWSH